MSDNSDNNYEPASAEEVFETLRRARTSHPAAVALQPSDSRPMSVRATEAGAVLAPGEAEAIAADRAASGVSQANVRNAIADINKRADWLRGRLAEGSHDTRSGAIVHAVQGTLREGFEVELAGLDEELRTSRLTLQAAIERDADAQRVERVRLENDAAESDWINGSPERAEALQKAKLELEAAHMAEWLLRRQFGG